MLLPAFSLSLALLAQDGIPPAKLPTTQGMDGELVSHIEQHVAAVEASPGDGLLHAELGLVYEANTCFLPAAQSYSNAIELLPESPEWRYRLGKVLIEIGDLEPAARELRLAAGALTNTPVIQARLGQVLLQMGDLEGAEAAWLSAISAEAKQPGQPMYPQSRVGLAGVRYEQERFEEAIQLCEQAIGANPGYRHARYLLALNLFEVGQDARAELELAAGMKAWPEFPPDPHGPRLAGHAKGYQRRMMSVENLMMGGNIQGAMALVEVVLTNNQADTLALNLKGRCHQALGQLDQAIEIFRACEAIDEARVDTKLFLAIALLNRSGSVTDAEQRTAMIKEASDKTLGALQLAPRQGRAHFFHGFALLASGDGQGAFAEMNIALRLGCDEPEIYRQLTQLAANLGRMREMIQFAEKNAATKPADPAALQLLIQAYLTDNKVDEAEAALQRLEAFGLPQLANFVASVKQFIAQARTPPPPISGPPTEDGKDQ